MVRTAGFTVLELVAGLAIAASVAGTAALRLPPVVASIRLAAAAHRLAATLRQARGRALAHDVRVDVVLDVARGTWTVRELGGAALAPQALPGGVAFTSVPAAGRVRFTTVGGADNATVVLAAGSALRRVIVNQRGRVRVQ